MHPGRTGEALLALLAGVALVGLLELGARLLLPEQAVDVKGLNQVMHMGGESAYMRFVKDPVLGYRLEHPGGEAFRDGWGQEHPWAKPEGVYRVVCLGGSTTWGTCADPRTTYPALLETLANQVVRCDGRRVEVINAGIMGYNSWHSLLRAQQELAPLRPDLYVLMDGLNDVMTAMQTPEDTRDQMEVLTRLVNLDAGRSAGLASRLDGWLRASALYRLMRRAAAAVAPGADAQAQAERRVARFGYEENMRRFIGEARARGQGVLLVNYPWIVRPGETHEAVDARLPYALDPNHVPYFQAGRRQVSESNARLAAQEGVPLADPQPLLDRATQSGENVRRLYCDTVHFTRLGNFLLAASVFSALRGERSFQAYARGCGGQDQAQVQERLMRAVDLHPHFAGGVVMPGNSGSAWPARALAGEEVREIDGDVAPWRVFTPVPGADKGRLRVEVRSGPAGRAHGRGDFDVWIYPRFATLGDSLLLRFWDGSEVRLGHPGGEGWSPIGERFGLRLPALDGGRGMIGMELSPGCQLWTLEGGVLFRNVDP